jgi:GAF domain-containing protein
LLAIPITIRGADFGVLYLAHDRPGRVFSESEDGIVRAMASASAVAIDNARPSGRRPVARSPPRCCPEIRRPGHCS